MPLLDHRLALVFLSLLIVAAGAPLAVAWSLLLPVEREPFAAPGATPQNVERNWLVVVLLSFTTLSYLVRLPGIPFEATLLRFDAQLLPPWPEYAFIGVTSFFVLVPALAACHSLLRPSRLRVPMIWSGVLVLFFWLAFPYLTASLLEN